MGQGEADEDADSNDNTWDDGGLVAQRQPKDDICSCASLARVGHILQQSQDLRNKFLVQNCIKFAVKVHAGQIQPLVHCSTVYKKVVLSCQTCFMIISHHVMPKHAAHPYQLLLQS